MESLRLSAVEITGSLYLRELIGACNAEMGARGINAFRRQLQVIVLLQRGPYQFLQSRVLEDLPPRQIGIGRDPRFGLFVFAQIAVGSRNLNDGLTVVRANLAARN